MSRRTTLNKNLPTEIQERVGEFLHCSHGLCPKPSSNIWLKLKGGRRDVESAKLFVKGIVNQEAQQEVPYPGVLYCVFCGARGLFIDCLIRNTSAHILVGSPGILLLSGLAEPVVRAYSLITNLVERYEGTQGRRTEPGDRGSGETLDSRRAFKSLVESREDRHTLDLLVLPGAVKETLLDLVRDSGLESKLGRRCLNPDPGLGLSPLQGLGSDLILGRSSYRVGLMDTANPRQWDGPSNIERLTLMDSRHGEAKDIHGILTTKPKPNNQDPWSQNIEQQMFTTQPIQSREVSKGGNKAAARDPIFHSYSVNKDTRGRAEGAEVIQGRLPQPVEEEEQGRVKEDDMETEDEKRQMLLSVGSKEEFGLLLKFFTAMGYTEDVVLRVLDRTGPKEASQILDLVQQEQDQSGQAMNHPVEMEHREGERTGRQGEDRGGEEVRRNSCGIDERIRVKMEGDAGVGPRGIEVQSEGRQSRKKDGAPTVNPVKDLTTVKCESNEAGEERGEANGESGDGGSKEDFVLGVLKRAAASCGYTEEKVAEVYSMLPELSTRQLLLELQREGPRETGADIQGSSQNEPREVDEVVSEVQTKTDRMEQRRNERGKEMETPAQPRTVSENRVARTSAKGTSKETGGQSQANDLPVMVELVPAQQKTTTDYVQPVLTKPRTVRGPPQPTYIQKHHTQPPPVTPMQPSQPIYPPLFPHQLAYTPTQPPQINLTPALTFKNPPSTSVNELGQLAADDNELLRQLFPNMSEGAMVTGQQRFLEGLQVPFDLKLTDQPGDPGLRMVIIDGSNVAMSHGLGHFFSCRGIALAVQHFWNCGHRRISIFLPQWRQKRDPRTTEQHYLTELYTLGLLSYTPSREVQGKRINSYDDRFMLQLAQKTDGVIVTNDNLRDLLDESSVWRDIIKKRLLQYTFVGDHFMVPDDPMGRGGPHLVEFLRSQPRPPVPGSHTFAGTSSSPFAFNRAPRAQTEVLQFRDRTPGAALEPESSQTRRRWRGKRHAKGNHSGPGMGLGPGVERSAAETSVLMESLCQVFPGQESIVDLVLQSNPTMTDINLLSHIILEQQIDSEEDD
ncbi:hypothetical protein UPYG_G00236370 [Umbra pygmaea]|uniref:RNase NYN domain-containing protein n=1 Tax=Umbra pygmaea TaxID=75934 RepID=A0ABD0WJ88_UMBPY